MTLIITLQTKSEIVMAADGMGYSQGDASTVPYATQKIHLANGRWAIAFCGWAGVEVQRKQLEAEIAVQTVRFHRDIDIGGPEYIETLHKKLADTYIPQHGSSKIILAGVAANGPSVIVGEITCAAESNKLSLALLEAPKVRAYGSQSSTAQWMLNAFVDCCKTRDELVSLACFAIWQVAEQELTQGQLPRYGISTAIVRKEQPPKIATPDSQQLVRTLNHRLARLKKAF